MIGKILIPFKFSELDSLNSLKATNLPTLQRVQSGRREQFSLWIGKKLLDEEDTEKGAANLTCLSLE
jgi:hypothetical protein